MRKVWLVAGREFWQRVRTRGFLLSSLLTPLILLVVLIGGNIAASDAETEELPADPGGATPAAIAYVDEAALVGRTPPGLPATLFHSFADPVSADAALSAGEIDAYYVIPPDYRETGTIRRVAPDLPSGPPDTALFDALLQANLLAEADAGTLARARNPFQSAGLTVVPIQGEANQEAGVEFDVMPFLVSLLVMVPLFTSGSYLLSSLTEEKSNRVMETLLTSLRPPALLVGKLLGLGALTLVQYLIWLLLGAGALVVVGQDLTGLTETINLTSMELLLVFLYAVGGYALYATLMAGLGALSPNLEATRSWVFVITLPMLIPIYLWVVLANAPNSALAVALSLIPFSAPMAMLMRLASTTVPPWQVVSSLLLLGGTAVLMVWLMSRLFRVQTLLSGEPFSPARFWRVLREG